MLTGKLCHLKRMHRKFLLFAKKKKGAEPLLIVFVVLFIKVVKGTLQCCGGVPLVPSLALCPTCDLFRGGGPIQRQWPLGSHLLGQGPKTHLVWHG